MRYVASLRSDLEQMTSGNTLEHERLQFANHSGLHAASLSEAAAGVSAPLAAAENWWAGELSGNWHLWREKICAFLSCERARGHLKTDSKVLHGGPLQTVLCKL